LQESGKNPPLEENVTSLLENVKHPKNFLHHKVKTKRQNVAKFAG